MVLGGGSSQIHLLQRALKAGFYVILADKDPDAPGRRYCSEFVEASTFDIDAVTQAASRTGAERIIAAGSDQPVLTAAAASAANGLPYPLSPETALAVTNKRIMKTIFHKADIPTVRWALADEDGNLTFEPQQQAEKPRPLFESTASPLVVKPVDSQGQRGVLLVDDRKKIKQAASYVLSYSREPVFLVEEYYPSGEVTVSGWVENEKCKIYAVTDRVTIDNPPSLGVCTAHRYPSRFFPEFKEEFETITRQIVSSFGIRSGPIYFQYLIGKEGIKVNEIACRLGGAYEDESLPRVTGIDIIGKLLGETEEAGGDRISRENNTNLHKYFSVPLIFCKPGLIREIHGTGASRKMKGVHSLSILQKPGTQITDMQNSTQRAAYAVISGFTVGEVNRAVDELFDTLRFSDERGNDLLIDSRDSCKLNQDL